MFTSLLNMFFSLSVVATATFASTLTSFLNEITLHLSYEHRFIWLSCNTTEKVILCPKRASFQKQFRVCLTGSAVTSPFFSSRFLPSLFC